MGQGSCQAAHKSFTITVSPPPHLPDLYAGEAVIVDIVLLQDPAPVVVEVDANLLAAVNPVASEDGLTSGGDPHSGQRVGVDLVALDDATPIIVLQGEGGGTVA